MAVPRVPRRPAPNTAAFLGWLLERRTRPSFGTRRRPPVIDPSILEATMTMGGWVSWEMVHFISEIAAERKTE